MPVWTRIPRAMAELCGPLLGVKCSADGGLHKLFTRCSREPSEAAIVPSENGGSEQAGDCIGFRQLSSKLLPVQYLEMPETGSL